MTDIQEVSAAFGLSAAETHDLVAIDKVLLETQEHTNLIARASVTDRWHRHYADSLQLWDHVPLPAHSLLDVGSGGGFPALPLAVLAKHRRPDLVLTLCESIGKKTAFLREAAAAANLDVQVENRRVERLGGVFDVVTARAVAALPKLLPLLSPRLAPGGLIVAPKGRKAKDELREAKEAWRMTVKRVKSGTDPDASILLISDPEPRS